MNPERQQAIDYLRAPANGLWQWAEDGAVIVWRDGGTIAFREELIQILEWLAPNGLPSFGSVVFLLAACRGKVPAPGDIVAESKAPLPAEMGKDAPVLLTARKQLQAQLEAALDQLKKVSQLPAELNSGIKARCVLAEAVFEPAKAERHVNAADILAGMKAPLGDADLLAHSAAGTTSSYVRQIHIVAEGLRPHTAESLALRMHTGLDALPEESDVDLPTAERAQKLIDELSRDRDVGMVARAARELMAAVRLPRRLGERDELALGGVADISNRGPLDRLLLSELAHDDLTLSVRVALNEALYLRREPPMREPPGTLALLIDSGVRLWGIPRVLATSVALALVACDKQHSAVQAWSAKGAELRAVDLLTRKGLIEHLGTLGTDAHPGGAVPAFADVVSNDTQNQSVLITHRDALDDPEFRRSLVAMAGQPGFVATVDRAGRFELHALPLARRTPLCEADLDMEAILDDGQAVPLRRKDVDPALPAIFGIAVFPFLLPVAGKLDYWMKAGDGFTYATLTDRQLVRFRDHSKGARVLSQDLPGSRTLWLDFVNGAVHLLRAGSKKRILRLVSLASPDWTLRATDIFPYGGTCAVHRYGDVILVIRHGDVRAYTLSDGRSLGEKTTPLQWLNGRFFKAEQRLYFASWDGSEVQFELVTLPKGFHASVIEKVFDREGVEGPWFFQRGGLLISAASNEQERLPMPSAYGVDHIRVSRDGHRILWVVASEKWGRLKDLKTGRMQNFLPTVEHCIQLDLPPPLPTRNVYRAVEALAVIPDGLAFSGRKGRWRTLTLNAHGRLHVSQLQEHENDFKAPVTFAANRTVGPGCTLQAAELPNGAKVFLDNRGLLHFKSKRPDLPEVSLVLAEDEVAGWTSDGLVCGPEFFFERPFKSEPSKVFERLRRIVNL